jgi:thioredoxin-related protein
MKVLEPYLNDPACPTTKRMEIERRLKGMETLMPGVVAPDFVLNNSENTPFRLSELTKGSGYILLLFWSADCSHCAETVNTLFPWSLKPEISSKLEVIAISLDETDAEITAWNNRITGLQGWTHLRAKEGINSKVANDYFILATPVMILIDRKTGKIKALPGSTEELKNITG